MFSQNNASFWVVLNVERGLSRLLTIRIKTTVGAFIFSTALQNSEGGHICHLVLTPPSDLAKGMDKISEGE